MTIRWFLILGALVGLFAHDGDSADLYKPSVITFVAGNSLDIASSYGRYEMNPLLSRNGQFSSQSVAIKAGIVGTILGVEWLILRHRPDFRKKLVWFNFAAGGAVTGVAIRNWRVQ